MDIQPFQSQPSMPVPEAPGTAPVTPPIPDPQPPAEPVLPPPPPHVEPPKHHKKQSAWRSVVSTLAILIVAPIIALTLTAFVFQSYQVDGPSMSNTLHNGDRLIIWKVPKTLARITGNDYLPKRGDKVVIVQRGPYEDEGDKEKQLIKRVGELSGERVVVKDGVLTVYNTDRPEGFQPDKELPYGKNIPTTTGEVDTVVPAGSIFVAGDNRPNSLDSRSFGAIPEKDIVGKLIARVLPLSDAEKF